MLSRTKKQEKHLAIVFGTVSILQNKKQKIKKTCFTIKNYFLFYVFK